MHTFIEIINILLNIGENLVFNHIYALLKKTEINLLDMFLNTSK